MAELDTVRNHEALLNDARQAFRRDSAYAISIAEQASSLRARKRDKARPGLTVEDQTVARAS